MDNPERSSDQPAFERLASTLTRWEVRLLGARSRRMSRLRNRWRAKFEGKRCLVLGSAPGARVPQAFDICLAVNGSPWTARQAGISAPSLTVVARYAIDSKTPKSRNTLAALAGLSTAEIVYIPLGQTEAEARGIFNAADFGFDDLTMMTRRERAIVIREASGRDLGVGDRDDRVSNGIFAASIAVWAGAKEIIMGGFSLKGGHGYIEGMTNRFHADADLTFMRSGNEIYQRTGSRLVTTSQEIHEASGLPLVP